ncbi:MAG: F0F1 ATP synthase subunit A [Endomicrobia bacterium]|nr:F0F1 ATP synthase subunit A [Endomicrobiia bacterium]MCL2506549.1 F0F1 ATP synthase subunit A [Endomicrobiia bacterium]
MQISPGVLFTIAGFPVTNTVLVTLIVDIIIVLMVFSVYKAMSLRPGRLQNAVESVMGYFYSATKDIAGDRVSFIYPWVLSFFIFIIFNNLIEFIPGFESIRFFSQHAAEGHEHGVPLFRAATSDLNLTLALAVISVIMSHFYSIKYTGIKSYIGRFFSLKMFGLFLLVGMIELISEFVKFISFSFRLFGNIFAGDIALGVTQYFFVMFAFEMFVGVIQAFVFAMLTMAFMTVLTEKSH